MMGREFPKRGAWDYFFDLGGKGEPPEGFKHRNDRIHFRFLLRDTLTKLRIDLGKGAG